MGYNIFSLCATSSGRQVEDGEQEITDKKELTTSILEAWRAVVSFILVIITGGIRRFMCSLV